MEGAEFLAPKLPAFGRPKNLHLAPSSGALLGAKNSERHLACSTFRLAPANRLRMALWARKCKCGSYAKQRTRVLQSSLG